MNVRATDTRKRFCSKKCVGIANGKRKAKMKESRLTATCICGAKLTYPKSLSYRRKFCSRDCANKAMATARVYEYGRTWPAQRRKARKRDCDTCQNCGSTDNLHVHHIVPFRISRDNRLRNLVTLCASCHTTEEARLRSIEEPRDCQLQFFSARALYKLTRRP